MRDWGSKETYEYAIFDPNVTERKNQKYEEWNVGVGNIKVGMMTETRYVG